MLYNPMVCIQGMLSYLYIEKSISVEDVENVLFIQGNSDYGFALEAMKIMQQRKATRKMHTH